MVFQEGSGVWVLGFLEGHLSGSVEGFLQVLHQFPEGIQALG